MVITNELVFNINKEKFLEKFDIVYMQTNEYSASLTKIVQNYPIKAISVYHTTGKRIYVLYKKNEIDIEDLQKLNYDNGISIGFDIFHNDKVILNLLLNSLNNFMNSNLAFNNVGGALFIYSPENKKKRQLKTLKVQIISKNANNPSDGLLLKVSTVSFINYNPEFHKNEEVYILSYKKFLRLATYEEINSGIDGLYVKGNYDGKKLITNFYTPDDEFDRATTYRLIYNMFVKKYNDLVRLDFKNIKISKINPQLRDTKITPMLNPIMDKKIHIIPLLNFDNDLVYSKEEIINLICKLKNVIKEYGFKISGSKNISKYSLVFYVIHNVNYYLDNEEDDPYSKLNREIPSQCVYLETLEKMFKTENGYKNPLNVCLKELTIKNDIIYNRKISINDWCKDKNYYFGSVDKDKLYVMKVDPVGVLDFSIEECTIFNVEELEKIKTELKMDKSNYFIKDDYGNLNTVSITNTILLPTDEVLNIRDRTKLYWEENFEGVFDVNEYEISGDYYYSVGCKKNVIYGHIKNATHLYKVNIKNGKNLIKNLVDTMCVDFVRYGTYTVLPYPVKYLREFIKIKTKE